MSAFNARDIPALLAACHPDMSALSSTGNSFEGTVEVRRWLQDMLNVFEIHVTVSEIAECAEVVTATIEWSASAPPDLRLTGTHTLAITPVDGKVAKLVLDR
ncbi:nuclear transport factor 2 family protein [Microbacterium endophyticum]|uniref:nuclear transport factor 2 family protein n=1 Tax=Microbacterium endophyticum TaxID=1526412 RepID=UPI00141BB306